MHELSRTARNGAEQDRGPVPPTQGPAGPKPAEATPRAEARTGHCARDNGCICEGSGYCPNWKWDAAKPTEAFPLADWDQAQKALAEIRGAMAYVRALADTFPDNAHVKVATDTLRQALARIASRLENAERACMSLGLPF